MTLFDRNARGWGLPFAAVWIVDAPWAHPFWSQYAVYLYDLTTPMGDKVPGLVFRPGMTHETMIFAIDPAHPVKAPFVWRESPIHRLEPANHGYQFRALTDAAAACRVQQIVTAIERQQLNPDTDYRRQWDALFEDGVSLRREPFSADRKAHERTH